MIIDTFKHICILNRHVLGMQKTSTRCFSLSNITKGVFNFFKSQPPTPPYNHICQAGDPVLRSKATPVDPKELQTPEFQKVRSTFLQINSKESSNSFPFVLQITLKLSSLNFYLFFYTYLILIERYHDIGRTQ